ncbi:hypothetical protein [Alsobacter sp. R-9]
MAFGRGRLSPMKSIAALLLTIALALFPLSGTRAVAAAAPQAHGITTGHGHAAVQSHDAHHVAAQADHAGHLHDGGGHAHAAMDAGADHDGGQKHCGSDAASSTCCNVTCHAMTQQVSQGVAVRAPMAAIVVMVALPLPSGIAFDGLLRPPKPA